MANGDFGMPTSPTKHGLGCSRRHRTCGDGMVGDSGLGARDSYRSGCRRDSALRSGYEKVPGFGDVPASRWRGMVKASQQEALLAVDLYNRRGNDRLLEAFFVHMHIAWLYLLHAESVRAGIDYRYRDTAGRLVRVDGEPKTWELQKCVEHRWPDQNDPVRRNLEKTVVLRNKIEHRWQAALTVATGGYAQALVLNYESEALTVFGPKFSLADQLRFPLFLAGVHGGGAQALIATQRSLPLRLRRLLADFDADLDDSVHDDRAI